MLIKAFTSKVHGTCADCSCGNINKITIIYRKDNTYIYKYFIYCSECENENIVKRCICGSINIMYDVKRQEISCKDCGLVLMMNPPYYCGYRRIKPEWLEVR